MDNASTGNKQPQEHASVAQRPEYEKPEVLVFAVEDVVRYGGISGFDGLEGAYN